MDGGAAEVIADVLGEQNAAALLAAMQGHDKPARLKARALDNALAQARGRGHLTATLILVAAHAVPRGERLLRHYAFLERQGRAPGLDELVKTVNASMHRCAKCRAAWVDLDAATFRATVAAAAGRRTARSARVRSWHPSGVESRRLTVVAGISGLAAAETIDRIRGTGDRQRTVIDLDQHLRVLTDHFLDKAGLLDKWRHQPPLERAFHLNARVLQDCWRLAFTSAVRGLRVEVGDADATLETYPSVAAALRDGDVLLRCHLAWYDRLSHGFIVAANGADLADLGLLECQKRVVVLLDDAYDAMARMIATRMYPHLASKGGTKLHDDLVKIIEWRRVEVLLGETAAQSLRGDFAVLPTKVPVKTFERIVDGAADDRVYLTYSATYPFEKGTAAPERKDWPRFVVAVSRALTAKTQRAVIDATALDDHRIKKGTTTLRPRWVWRLDPAEPVAYVDLPDEVHGFPDNPFERRGDTREDFASLWREQYDLVHARGRSFARECGGLILLRPFAGSGRLRDGMDIVADQHRRLVAYARGRPEPLAPPWPRQLPAVVFHTREDEWRRRAYVIAQAFIKTFGEFNDTVRPLTKTQERAVHEELAGRTEHVAALARRGAPTVADMALTVYESVTKRPAAALFAALGGRFAEFEAALGRRVRDALDVTKHPRATAREDDEPGVPAFFDAVFVVADTWRSVEAKDLAVLLDKALDHARAGRSGVLYAGSIGELDAARGVPKIDWSRTVRAVRRRL